jgi:glutaredoxin-related protein
MLFRETAAVYCENHINLQIHFVGVIQSINMLKSVGFKRLREKKKMQFENVKRGEHVADLGVDER